MTTAKNTTRWFSKQREGDNYYGRIYNGRTYELIPVTPPKLNIKGAQPYFDDGLLPLYSGTFLSDSNTRTVVEGDGSNFVKFLGSSGEHRGDTFKSYYLAEMDGLSVELEVDGPSITIGLDATALERLPDSEAARNLIAFIATAQACESLSSINLQNEQYKDKIDGDEPIHAEQKVAVWITLGQVQMHLERPY